MVNLDFYDKHNMIAYLQKSEGSEGFHQIIDFLTTSHIKYALTENPTIYVSLIEQFWQTATASTLKDGDMGITAIIDGKVKVVFEAPIRRHLKLEDSDGISTLSTTVIFEQLALMGHKRLLLPHKRIYIAPTLTQKLFSNMKKASKGYTRVDTPLFQTMLVQGQTLQGEGSTIPAPLMPYDSPLQRVHSLGSDEGSLILNELTVKKLEHKVKSIKARRKVRLVISDDKDDLEDPSKQGRKIARIDKDEGITLVQMGAQTQGRSDEDLMYETGVYDYPEGFTRPSISITTAEPVTTAGKGVSTARTIPEKVSTAEPDMDVTLAEALVDLLKSGNKKSPKPKAREQAKFERLQKERVAQEEASKATIYEEMDNIQAMIEADEQLAARVQDEEQELYSIEEKSRLLVEMIAKRKRFFTVAQRAAEQRSKPLPKLR
ncbi:hypothetical protein Tco_0591452 [Tanacetum coccineum]